MLKGVIVYNQKEGRTKQVLNKKEVKKMTIEERKVKAREIIEQYFKEAQFWCEHDDKDSARASSCCARFAVAVEMYEVLTGEKYI